MKGQLKKISIIFVMIITITIFLVSSRSMALEVQTHRAINEYITQTPLNNFFLDDYLKTQLGMQTGVKTKYNNQEVFKWISEGGEFEDDGLRPRSHFLNPLTNQGLVGICYSALGKRAQFYLMKNNWIPAGCLHRVCGAGMCKIEV